VACEVGGGVGVLKAWFWGEGWPVLERVSSRVLVGGRADVSSLVMLSSIYVTWY
jgi:hypothetical protein